jgi:hypothetical protein
MSVFSKYQKIILVTLGVAALSLLAVFNPYEVSFFPRCPFHSLTGFLCPGCGSQRCLHFLLTGQFSNAFREHALIPFAIPYLGFHIFMQLKKRWKKRDFQLREFFFGQKAIFALLGIVLVFTVLRNF